jgi:kinesin family member C1
MLGGAEEHRGIIPRSIELILSTVAEGRSNGWEYGLEASFLEIYNEAVRSILCVRVY